MFGLASDEHRTFDLSVVSPHRFAVFAEYMVLPSEILSLSEGMPDIGVLGDELQRFLFTAPADDEGDMA